MYVKTGSGIKYPKMVDMPEIQTKQPTLLLTQDHMYGILSENGTHESVLTIYNAISLFHHDEAPMYPGNII